MRTIGVAALCTLCLLAGTSRITDAQTIDELKKSISDLNDRVSELESEKKMAGNTMRAYWKDGLRFETDDGDFRIQIGGRIMHDWAWFDANGNLETATGEEFDDSTEFRRARLYVGGLIYKNVEFKAQYDFADSRVKPKDVYIGLINLPFGKIRVGHIEEPFSLEKQTSSKYITFMERSILDDAFVPGRNAGIMVSDNAIGGRVTWAAGVFRDTDDYGNDTGNEYSITGRFTGAPWMEDNGRKLLHLGASASYRNAQKEGGKTVSFSAVPESHLSPADLVDTGTVPADDMNLFGTEAALVYGSFSLQGEYMVVQVDGRDGTGDPELDGFYLAASYFLTGENRPYKDGAFIRVKPKNNFLGKQRGFGAWEMAARYSSLDLQDTNEGAVGGELDDYTIGLNWYLNPNVRVMFNYVMADPDKKYGDSLNVFETRFQIDF